MPKKILVPDVWLFIEQILKKSVKIFKDLIILMLN